MKLILISLPEKINTDSETELIKSFFKSGLEVFHLRKPDFSKEETIEFLNKIPSDFLNKIVLHQHHTLVQNIGLKGIHLTEKVRGSYSKKDFDSIKTNYSSSTISTSIHDVKNLNIDMLSLFNYCFLGPVFPSISKPGYQGNLEINNIKEHLKTFKITTEQTKIIALGGIAPEKIEMVKTLGFDGIGVIGAVWNSTNPLKALEMLLSECDKAKSER